jgi:predicted peroxiredoxin
MYKPFIRLIAVAAALFGATAYASEKPALFTILTEAEPQTQLMAFVLANQSRQQGAEVHVLLCGPAADIALKDAPASATAPQKPAGMSPQALMGKLMEAGGTVQVCAIYLPNKGVGPDALRDGVTPANPAEMAARLLSPNTRIMSF